MDPNQPPLLHYVTVYGLTIIGIVLLLMALASDFRAKRIVTMTTAILVVVAAVVITFSPQL